MGIVETIAHFTAAKKFEPQVDFIIDIGGQGIKCFKIRNVITSYSIHYTKLYDVVYSTDAKTANGIKVICEAPEGSHSPVVYPAAILETSENTEAARNNFV